MTNNKVNNKKVSSSSPLTPAIILYGVENKSKNNLPYDVLADYCYDNSLDIQHKFTGTFKKPISNSEIKEMIRNTDTTLALVVDSFKTLGRTLGEVLFFEEMVQNEKLEIHFVKDKEVHKKESYCNYTNRLDVAELLGVNSDEKESDKVHAIIVTGDSSEFTDSEVQQQQADTEAYCKRLEYVIDERHYINDAGIQRLPFSDLFKLKFNAIFKDNGGRRVRLVMEEPKITCSNPFMLDYLIHLLDEGTVELVFSKESYTLTNELEYFKMLKELFTHAGMARDYITRDDEEGCSVIKNICDNYLLKAVNERGLSVETRKALMR